MRRGGAMNEKQNTDGKRIWKIVKKYIKKELESDSNSKE